MILACPILAHAVNQDVYYHTYYNSSGESMRDYNYTETLFATDEEATQRSVYYIDHIIDDNGVTHTLWWYAMYLDKWEDTWIYTDGWELSDDEIQAFWDAHTN